MDDILIVTVLSKNIDFLHSHWRIQGAPPTRPPQQDPILSFSHPFLHTFSPKSACIGGRRPPTGNPGSATGSQCSINQCKWLPFNFVQFLSLITKNTSNAKFCVAAGSAGRSPSTRGHAAQRGRSTKQRQQGQRVATSPQPPSPNIEPSMLLSERKSTPEKQHVIKENEETTKQDNKMTNESAPQKDTIQDSVKDMGPDSEKVLGKELDEKEFIQ